jgi:hypothetical protein
MATWEDVDRIVSGLPETSEGSAYGMRAWRVRKKLVVWERPLRKSDLRALGAAAPDGPILGAIMAHVLDKDILIARAPDIYFTTPHFDGYPAILVQLERISVPELESLIEDAWVRQAPKRLAKEYLESKE